MDIESEEEEKDNEETLEDISQGTLIYYKSRLIRRLETESFADL